MRIPAVFLAALVASSAPAAAHDPITGTLHSFFGGYRAPQRPVGGNCSAIAAQVGPAATWLGTFGGKRVQPNDHYKAFGTQACFTSERDCRMWQQDAISYAQGPIQYTSCKLGVSARYLR